MKKPALILGIKKNNGENMSAIDSLAYKSPFRSWPPLGKLLFSLSLLCASILSPTPLVPLVVFLIGIALLYRSTSLRLPRLMGLACLNTFALLSISVLIIAAMAGGTPIWGIQVLGATLSVSAQSANLAILIFMRAIAGFSVLLFFATSTPVPHLFIALRQMGVPKHVSELTVLVYRYSFLVIEQAGQMWQAADCRLGFSSAGRAVSTSGYLVGNLFIRCMDFAERSQKALECRNFNGSFEPLRLPSALTWEWAAASAVSFAALFLAGQAFQNAFVL